MSRLLGRRRKHCCIFSLRAGANYITVVTSDLENIINARDFLQIILFAPLQCAISIYGLHILLGWRYAHLLHSFTREPFIDKHLISAFVGLAVMVICFPLPGLIVKKMQSMQREVMKKTDTRVSAVTESAYSS